jgi:predicted nucleic acid-binding protein
MAHPANEPLFADTFFLLALLVEEDEAHSRALAWHNLNAPLVTTTWVLIELADALSKPGARETAARFISFLRADHRVTVVGSEPDLFDAGFHLYESRPDKAWSLTDCLSFEVMRRRKLLQALTGDHHFEQAGFVALLK